MRSTSGMHYDSYGEEALLALVARRDALAFEALYRRHAGLVRLLLRRILADVEDVEDCAQDVFARVWQRAESYRPSGAGPRAWIVTIARNAALDRLRRCKVRPQTEPLESGAPVPNAELADDPAAATLRAEIRRHVRAALQGLSEDQREALELAYFSGLTQREIAERTHSPLGTVKSRIRLAMRHLRERLEPVIAEELHA